MENIYKNMKKCIRTALEEFFERKTDNEIQDMILAPYREAVQWLEDKEDSRRFNKAMAEDDGYLINARDFLAELDNENKKV